MARVIQGIPVSWDPSIANIRFQSEIQATAWSPCSRFIAVASYELPTIVVLDAGTLEQLHTINLPQSKLTWSYIVFSPGTHLITAYSWGNRCIVNWDFQTGGLLSNISSPPDTECTSVSYSLCETVIGVLFSNNTVVFYNVLSGILISSHSIQQPIIEISWTHGEFLQFATIESESIAAWQVSFTSSNAPTLVGSLSIPHNFSSEELVLLPTLSRLAFILDRKVVVWDAPHHKVLLDSADAKNPRAMSFSTDGHFFLCGTQGREFYIWKESPIGYLLHQKLVSGASEPTPHISLNRESVISSSGQILQLWNTKKSSTPLPNIPMQTLYYLSWIFIEFSPDQSLVAFTEGICHTVTVLDTNSGNPWLVLDTDTMICGLRMTEDEIIVVGDGKVVAWDLPARNSTFNIRRDINDIVQTLTFKHSGSVEMLHASISPDLNYFAIGNQIISSEDLSIYSLHTGEILAVARSDGYRVGFTPDSLGVWCPINRDEVDQWEIIKENGSNSIKLKELNDTETLWSFPWLSSYGYQVTNDGWILNSSGKCLLWLPYHWRPDKKMQRKWSGKFLGVWNENSPSPYILELEV